MIEHHVLGSVPNCGKSYLKIPERGINNNEIVNMLNLARTHQKNFDDGKSPGGIYHSDNDRYICFFKLL